MGEAFRVKDVNSYNSNTVARKLVTPREGKGSTDNHNFALIVPSPFFLIFYSPFRNSAVQEERRALPNTSAQFCKHFSNFSRFLGVCYRVSRYLLRILSVAED